MAQNITLMGASYSDVPAVELPKTGGGTASFTDVTDTTATAPDVSSGKYFYTSAGVRTLGTGTGTGMSDDVKNAILACFEHVAWVDDQGLTYYDALYSALHDGLVSISAVYTQSSTIYDTDTLDDLKPDLVVTATYGDSTTRAVTGYILSGTLTAGTSTITATYQGETATFTVTVTADVAYIAAVYTQSGTVYTDDSLDSLKTDLVVTYYADAQAIGVVLSASDYTLSGTLVAGTSTITVTYIPYTTTFTVNNVSNIRVYTGTSIDIGNATYGAEVVDFGNSTGVYAENQQKSPFTVDYEWALPTGYSFITDDGKLVIDGTYTGSSTNIGGYIYQGCFSASQGSGTYDELIKVDGQNYIVSVFAVGLKSGQYLDVRCRQLGSGGTTYYHYDQLTASAPYFKHTFTAQEMATLGHSLGIGIYYYYGTDKNFDVTIFVTVSTADDASQYLPASGQDTYISPLNNCLIESDDTVSVGKYLQGVS